MKIALSFSQKKRQIQNSLEFAASLSSKANTYIQLGGCDMCPFLKCHFELIIIQIYGAVKAEVKDHVCYFLNLLLTAMPDDTYFPNEWREEIIEAMLFRISDISPKVRIQAVYVLHKMQKPWSDECDVIDAYLFHLSNDCSPDVRKAVIKNLETNRKTLEAVLERIHDVNDSVKKEAYVFLFKVSLKSFKIEEVQTIIRYGLLSKDEIVKVIRDLILPACFANYNDSIIDFLHEYNLEYKYWLSYFKRVSFSMYGN